MKVRNINIWVLILALLFSACEDFLEKEDEIGITDEELFNSYSGFKSYLDYAYKGLFDYHLYKQNTAASVVSDQYQCPSNTGWQDYAKYINTGLYNNGASAFEVGWKEGNGYGQSGIFYTAMQVFRVVNKVIEKAPTSTILTEGQSKDLLGQAYFLRAFFHFELIKRYGGMPYFDRVYDVDENLDFPRLSYEESTQRIVQDCEAAVDLLGETRSGNTFGRASGMAAIMLKSMALLYDASPTMNIANGYGDSYNELKCETAATAAWETLQFAENAGIDLQEGKKKADYLTMFYSTDEVASKEAVFLKLRKGFVGWSGALKQLYVPSSFGVTGNRYTVATQNLVDMFETKNGLAIEDDPEYDNQNPYSNRDPRLKYSVLYHGQQHGLDESGQKRYIDFSYDKNGDASKHGVDIKGSGNDIITSYYVRKFFPDKANNWEQFGNYYMNWTYMRLTQAYLDYAEAVNEAYGPNGTANGSSLTAIEAVNIVRDRVGMPPVNDLYTGSKEAFRKRIWNERNVEFNGEFQRWWDMRRWHIAHLPENKQIKGMKITRDNITQELTYEVVDVQGAVRIFEEKHYWYPLPQNHIYMLENFEQNPGW